MDLLKELNNQYLCQTTVRHGTACLETERLILRECPSYKNHPFHKTESRKKVTALCQTTVRHGTACLETER